VTITYIGSLSVGGVVPGASAAINAGMTGINSALANLLAQLAALQAFAPSPISFAAQLSLAESMVSSLNLAIGLGMTPPDILAQITAILALVAALTAQIGAIEANLDVMLDLQLPLAAAGVHAYAYDGTAGALGGELGGALGGGVPGGSGGGQHANALALVATSPATWAALSLVFKVAP